MAEKYYLITVKDAEETRPPYLSVEYSNCKAFEAGKQALLSKAKLVDLKETILGNEFNLPEGTVVKFLFVGEL